MASVAAVCRPGFSCRTPSSKRELAGARGYATIISAGQIPGGSEAPDPVSTAAPPTYSTRSRQPEAAPGPCAAPAEAACAANAPTAGTLDACASSSLDAVAGAIPDRAHAARSAAGGVPCCSFTILVESSRVGAGAQLGGQAAECERNPLSHADSAATHQHCKADCSHTMLQSSIDSVASVQSLPLAEAPTQQQGGHASTVMTQQSAASDDTVTGEVKTLCKPTTPCLFAAAASPQTTEPLAAGVHADDSASGSPCCDSKATCTAAPAWTWATVRTMAAASKSDPVVASCEEHAGTCGDAAHTSVPAEAFEGHLQAALQLQPLHATVSALELEEDEVQVPWTNYCL